MSLLVVNLIALFVIGFLQDVLGTYYLRLVNEHRFALATVISFVHNIVGWAIWFWFLYQFQNPNYVMSGLDATIWSLGGAAGTYIALRKPSVKLAKA